MAEDEDEDDGQADFGQQHLVLLGRRLEGGGLRGHDRRAPAAVVLIDDRQAFEGQQIEDDLGPTL